MSESKPSPEHSEPKKRPPPASNPFLPTFNSAPPTSTPKDLRDSSEKNVGAKKPTPTPNPSDIKKSKDPSFNPFLTNLTPNISSASESSQMERTPSGNSEPAITNISKTLPDHRSNLSNSKPNETSNTKTIERPVNVRKDLPPAPKQETPPAPKQEIPPAPKQEIPPAPKQETPPAPSVEEKPLKNKNKNKHKRKRTETADSNQKSISLWIKTFQTFIQSKKTEPFIPQKNSGSITSKALRTVRWGKPLMALIALSGCFVLCFGYFQWTLSALQKADPNYFYERIEKRLALDPNANIDDLISQVQNNFPELEAVQPQDEQLEEQAQSNCPKQVQQKYQASLERIDPNNAQQFFQHRGSSNFELARCYYEYAQKMNKVSLPMAQQIAEPLAVALADAHTMNIDPTNMKALLPTVSTWLSTATRKQIDFLVQPYKKQIDICARPLTMSICRYHFALEDAKISLAAGGWSIIAYEVERFERLHWQLHHSSDFSSFLQKHYQALLSSSSPPKEPWSGTFTPNQLP